MAARRPSMKLVALWFGLWTFILGIAAYAALNTDLPGVAAVFAVIAVLAGAVAYGLLRYNKWARRGALLLSILGLFWFPIGTVIGAVVIWQLYKKKSTLAFNATEEERSRMARAKAAKGKVSTWPRDYQPHIAASFIAVFLLLGLDGILWSQWQASIARVETATPIARVAATPTPRSPTPTPIPPTLTRKPTSTPTHTPTPRPTSTSTPTPLPDAVVDVEVGNLRAGPGTEYDVIGQVKKGDNVTVFTRNSVSNWVKVQVSSQSGWLSVSLLELNIPLASVAVETNIPLPPTPSMPTATPTPKACPPSPALVELDNRLSSALTLIMSGPDDFRVRVPSNSKLNICFTPGTYSYTAKVQGYKDSTGTKKFDNYKVNGCNCWSWYVLVPPIGDCECPSYVSAYSRP